MIIISHLMLYLNCVEEKHSRIQIAVKMFWGELGAHVSPMEELKQQIRNKPISATKFVTYREVLNPDLEFHDIYKSSVYIPDYLRVAFSRLRLMSHNLKIETGRWSRLPRESRLCI